MPKGDPIKYEITKIERVIVRSGDSVDQSQRLNPSPVDGVPKLVCGGPVLAHCAHSAYGSLTGFTARSRLPSKARKGSIPAV